MVKIIIIGTGNLGKRHIQAIANLEINYELICHDISEESLSSVDGFIEENNLKLKNIKKETNLKNTLQEIDKETIVIIASTAKGRKELLEETIKKRPFAIITEKPVCQNDKNYLSVLELNKEYQVPIYVNFSRHTFPDYQKILNELKDEEISSFTAYFPNVGMGCNGAHILDLAIWLLHAKDYEILSSKVNSTYESKRKTFSDFSGNLRFKLNNINCLLEMDDPHSISTIEVASKTKVIKIMEGLGKKVTIKNNGEVEVQNFEIVPCSKMTDKIILDLINNKKPSLPNIEEAYLPHKILFEFMKKHEIENLNIT